MSGSHNDPLSAKVSRRAFVHGAGLALAYSLSANRLQSAAGPDAPASLTRPNILVIVADQERAPQHWPDGWAAANLPAHQRLADKGISFSRAYCNAAMCSPSRATLFTGLYSMQHGVTRTLTYGGTLSDQETPLPIGFPTIGNMLADAGYRVVLKGKWHVSKATDGGPATAADVAGFGFDEWEPNTGGENQEVKNFGGGCADWDRQFVDQAVAFLQTQTPTTTASQPFALVVTLVNPHDVLSYPLTWDQQTTDDCSNYADTYAGGFPRDISLPPTIDEDLSTKPDCQADAVKLYNALGVLGTSTRRLDYVNFYADLIKRIDAQVGQILDALHPDLVDNTIIIYTADHGELGLSHGELRQKMFTIYDETVRVPLIISNPTLFPTPKTTDGYVSLIDLAPTLASIAGVAPGAIQHMRGIDLTPMFDDPDLAVQNEILFVFDDEQAGQADGIPLNPATQKPIVRQPNHIRCLIANDTDGEWKYARYFDPSGDEGEQHEMYHLTDGDGQPVDPNETDNIAHLFSDKFDQPFYVAKRNQLAQRLAAAEATRLAPENGLYLPYLGQGSTR